MNIAQIRAETPQCQNKIFINSAGASLMPEQIVKSIHNYLLEEAAHGGYKVADTNASIIANFYKEAAKLINTQPHNIAFAHDATDAYTKALSSIPFKKGDVIITSEDDYSSNQIQFLSLKERFGIVLKRIKTLANGDLDIAHFQELVAEQKPVLVAITHIPTNSGLIQDVESIGKICATEDIIFLVDACQSVGQMVVDVQQINCDFLTTTGRKFLRGPRGTGFLYVSDKVLNKGLKPLFIDGNGADWMTPFTFKILADAKRFEHWERPYALMVGFTTALRYANTLGMANIQQRNQILMQRFRANLAAIPTVTTFDKGSRTANILTFRKGDKSPEQIQEVFDNNKIYHNVSTKNWGVIDYAKKGVDWTIRLSPHYFNTLAEMDTVAEIIDSI
ncbi:MAG: aminotransferase class V-fold PLP-dependent enzyme [Saprospiraceae bacterium]